MANNKLISYLGFCIRSGKIVFGVDAIEQYKKRVHLLFADGSIGPNSMKILIKAKENFSCELLMTTAGALGEWLHRPAVKAVAILDKNLAQAILSVIDGEPQVKSYSGGNN